MFDKLLLIGALDASVSSKIARHNKESMKLARTFFVLFLAFTVCWTPFALIILVDYSSKAPHLVDMFFEILAHSNSSINVFLYGLSNNHFRAGYVKFLHLDRLFSSFKIDEGNSDSKNGQNNDVNRMKKLQDSANCRVLIQDS